MNHYDIVVVGTGTGGSTITYKLAQSGKKILVLERGGFIPKEKENWDPHQVVTAGRYRPKEDWYDKQGKPFKPFIHYNVGGNSKMYGAAMFRFRESDFRQVQHHGGISPAWPLDYAVFEPYYSIAEKMYSVHGERGADPTEPWTSGPYPLPPLAFEPLTEDLFQKLRLAGINPFPLPMGIRLPQDYTNIEAPVLLSNFDGFPDPTEAKADGHTSALRPALSSGNVTLLTNAFVDWLETDQSGKQVTKIHARVNNEKVVFHTDLVILACGAVNTAALMLRSKNTLHPDGLANSSGQVGRNLMLHHNGCLVAFTKKKNNSVFQKSFGIADYYEHDGDGGLPLGEIQLMGRNDPDTILWLAKDKFPGKTYEELAEMSIDFWITAEDLPSPENRVTLTKEGNIQVHYTPNNYTAYERLKLKLKTLFDRLGEIDADYKDVYWNGYDLDVSGMSHQNGTMRFGRDSRTSVLDLNCRTHDLENVYVADASFFPSCGAFNPALTIAANALRIGDHILEHVLNTPASKSIELSTEQLLA